MRRVFWRNGTDVPFSTSANSQNTSKAAKLLIHFVYWNSREVDKIVFVPRKSIIVAFITNEKKIQLKFTNKWAKNFSDAKLRKEKTLEIINFKSMNMYTFRWETRQSGFCFGLVGFMNSVTTVVGSSGNLNGNRILRKLAKIIIFVFPWNPATDEKIWFPKICFRLQLLSALQKTKLFISKTFLFTWKFVLIANFCVKLKANRFNLEFGFCDHLCVSPQSFYLVKHFYFFPFCCLRLFLVATAAAAAKPNILFIPSIRNPTEAFLCFEIVLKPKSYRDW